jgi:outer membrane biosynthesis protein TonB
MSGIGPEGTRKQVRAAPVGRNGHIFAVAAATAAVAVMLLGAAGLGTAGLAAGAPGPREAAAPYPGDDRNASLVILAQSRSEPAIILGPLPDETVPEAPKDPAAQSTVAEEVEREPPPIPRKKPERKTVSAPKPAQQKAPAQKAPAQKAPAQKAPAQKAPAKPAISPPQQAKDCDYCYGCWSSTPTCKRQWVCGKRYSELLAAGLCRR